MPEIIIEKNVSEEKLKELGVSSWNIWDCPVSEFRLDFDDKSERSFILEGELVVTPDGGTPVTLVPGDYIIFPVGLKSVWEVTKTLKKNYLHF